MYIYIFKYNILVRIARNSRKKLRDHPLYLSNNESINDKTTVKLYPRTRNNNNKN